jgi:hypothetical protein
MQGNAEQIIRGGASTAQGNSYVSSFDKEIDDFFVALSGEEPKQVKLAKPIAGKV